MITVFIPDNFIPERTYAVNTLLNHYAGYAIKIVPRPGQLHYEVSFDDKKVIIKDQFFGKTQMGESYLRINRIPEHAIQTTISDFGGIVIIYGEEKIGIDRDTITSDADLFAGAFFMLTRWEESFGNYEDRHGRFPAEKALIVRSGFILRPVVDEYVVLLRKWISSLGYPKPEVQDKFAVVPTCDVDNPFYWRSRPGWRLLAGRFLKSKSFRQLRTDWHLLRSVRRAEKPDPYDSFDYLMTLAEKNGGKFIFYMITGGETPFEGFYKISDARIVSLMNRFMQRGHAIGLHPSYNAFNDPKKIDSERRILEKYSGVPVQTSRQHYLRFAVPETWRHLHNAYIKEDTTLGYAAEPGFRCGTCKPFPVFDIHRRQEIPLMERPLLIMDVSLKIYKQFTIEESMAYCGIIKNQVVKHKGELVFLWHNSSLSEIENWEEWLEVLEYLIAPI